MGRRVIGPSSERCLLWTHRVDIHEQQAPLTAAGELLLLRFLPPSSRSLSANSKGVTLQRAEGSQIRWAACV